LFLNHWMCEFEFECFVHSVGIGVQFGIYVSGPCATIYNNEL
jgi:hypothetical protein